MVDIHNYQRHLDRTLKRIRESELLKINKTHLLDFNRYCLTEGISANKTNRYFFDILKISERPCGKPIGHHERR